jgi:hypothetical protein
MECDASQTNSTRGHFWVLGTPLELFSTCVLVLHLRGCGQININKNKSLGEELKYHDVGKSDT